MIGVTLSASLWKWTHGERSARAIERLSDGRGVIQLIGSAGPIRDTDDEHLQVALVLPDKWRIESDDRFELRSGSTRWYGQPERITVWDDSDIGLDQTDLGIMVEPGTHLMGVIRFEDPVEDDIEG